MTPSTDADATASPITVLKRSLGRAWRDLLSIYYANTPIWRLLKSVGLLFFGFFCWSASSLVLSYGIDWGVLYVLRAYGFVLILWGPLTHAVIVPSVIRLRRTADGGVRRVIARHGSKLNLSIFLTIVLLLTAAPISPMVLDFQSALSGDSSPDVDPDLTCEGIGEEISCELSDPTGIERVVVTSGDAELERVEDPPYEFTIREDDLEEVVGQKEFVVELQDEDGETLRRYRKYAASVSNG
ncbi:hypothetical protein C479_07768 [Halovivax asiaticus JCM 14624]|uniref:Uncharacterized protein n=1 Tax=Halovivax asiaticus JCM 14624 TaxID=1227490 RepID=M0BIH8_9EURY|nr:hypothetical protein [Halovivax asiaticus]ELZ10691.1 hypothetical protein C479_07768 [Halovivax asiaticus JCM 14624]